MVKKVAISGYYGFKNFGDELILSILTEKLKQKDVEITVFSVDPDFTQNTYGVSSVKTFNPFDVFKTIFNCDVLVSGGGSLFQDATSIKSVIYYSFVLFLAQILRKKTIIFAQGVGPLYSPLSRFLVKNLFKSASAVSVRDEKSFLMLNEWGIKSQLVEDPAYSIKLENIPKKDILGVQLRSFVGLDEAFLRNLAIAVTKLPQKTVKVFSLQKSLDFDICEKFMMILDEFAPEKEIKLVEDDLISELSSLDTLVSMRFHSLIVALKAGVKCSVINYDPKVKNLCEKYNLPQIEFNESAEVIDNKINNAQSVLLPESNSPWDNLLNFVS